MNQKHAREARIVNRTVGNLVKKGELPVDVATGITIIGSGPGKSHKLPRRVKSGFDKLSHRTKGRLTQFWRGMVAKSLMARGVTPKGNRKLHQAFKADPAKLSRRVRRAIQQAYRAAETP